MSHRPRAVVTGATSGIGLAFAVEYARLGYDLLLVARSERDLDVAGADLAERFGVQCAKLASDLSTIDGVDRKSTRLNSSHEWISRMPSSA